MKLKPSTIENLKAEKHRMFIEKQYRKDADCNESDWTPFIVLIVIAMVICIAWGIK